MVRSALPLTWILAFATVGSGPDDSRKLTVAAKLQSTSVLVGQAVEIQVAVVAGKDRPTVVPPKVNGAELTLFATETQPISVSAIGDEVNQQTVYRFRYRVISRKVGTLVIPPFSATVEERRGFSSTSKLKVNELPREGRTADFLGGVGSFEVSAAAKASSIRLGQDFEYRIQVTGTAARGIREAPSLERLARAQPELRVDRLPDEASDEPPSRVFTWKIRPKLARDLKIPPVSIAAYDPKLGRYITKATAGIALKVVDIPALDPKSVKYGPAVEIPRKGARVFSRVTWLIGAIVLSAMGVALLRFQRRRSQSAARKLVGHLQRRLVEEADPTRLGLLINEIMKEYLTFHSLHSTGALTPAEARFAVERLTRSSELGLRAEALMAQSDRIWFGGETGEEDREDLKRTAVRFLEDLVGVDAP